jgi:hypothetical protein
MSLRARTWWWVIILSVLFWVCAYASSHAEPIPSRYHVDHGFVSLQIVPDVPAVRATCQALSAQPIDPKTMMCSRGLLIVAPDPWVYPSPVRWFTGMIHELAHALGGWPSDHPRR